MTGRQVEYLEIAESYEATAEAAGEWSSLSNEHHKLLKSIMLAHAETYRRLAYPKNKSGPTGEEYTQG